MTVFEVHSLKQQLFEAGKSLCDSNGTPLLSGDIILQAELKKGGEAVFTLSATEALELASQLILMANARLKRINE